MIDAEAVWRKLSGAPAKILLLVMFGQAIGLITNIFLARSLGAEELGAFLYHFSWALLIGQFTVGGFDRLMIKEVASAQETHKKIRCVPKMVAIWLLVICSSLLATFLGTLYANLFDESLLDTAILAVAPISIVILQSSFLRGAGKVIMSQFWDKLGRQALFLALTIVAISLLPRPASAELVLGLSAVSYLMTALLAAVVSRATLRAWKWSPLPKSADYKAVIIDARPLFATVALHALLARVDILLLGVFSNSEQIAFYSNALKLAQVGAIVPSVYNTLIGPQIAAYHASGRLHELQNAITANSRATLFASSLVCLPLVAFGSSMLAFFGEEFRQAYLALIVLTATQLVAAFSGAAGSILTYCGKESYAVRALLTAGAVGVGITCIFAPAIGALGASIGAFVGMALRTYLLSKYARILTGLKPQAL
jgi:O-antigen/teichoic acid export membrane protein